jgi:hypothetical protein
MDVGYSSTHTRNEQAYHRSKRGGVVINSDSRELVDAMPWLIGVVFEKQASPVAGTEVFTR